MPKTVKINDTCINCGMCVSVCPHSAIEPADGKHTINKNCTRCGECLKNVCPVDAIEGGE
ncbi:MAG: 4Fe-4S binding protein [Firmicutes bacterium]|nr:4Fe-4S binding protein [Bacillota bacterium]